MFLLNLKSKVPIYEQIRDQILRFIEAGVMHPGDRLPSVRQLAKDNGINPNTVAKAYSELEIKGYVYNVPKKGVYVAAVQQPDAKEQQILSVLRPLRESGITREELIQAVDHLYREELENAED